MKNGIDPITKITIAMRRHRIGLFSAYTTVKHNFLSRLYFDDEIELFGLDGGHMPERERKKRYYEE